MILRFAPLLALCLVLPVAGAWAAETAPAPTPSVNMLLGELQNTTTKYEDTLVHLARKYNVGFVALRAANPGVDPWLPGAGTQIIVPTQHILPDAPHQGVVINLPEMRMYVFNPGDAAPMTFPIGIGRSGLTTPLGTTTVTRKAIDPIWYPTERMRKEDPTLPAAVPPGPENPMGTHAFYLGWPSYAIHGTDKPYSVGRRLSSGCIRMYPEDVLTLDDHIALGTTVTVVDQPIKTAWINDQFYIEAHPTQEQTDILSRDTAHVPEYKLTEADTQTILKGAGAGAAHLDWAKIRKVVKERRGVPMIVATRGVTPDEAAAPASATADNKDTTTTDAKPAPQKEGKKNVTKEAAATPTQAAGKPALTPIAAEARGRYQN